MNKLFDGSDLPDLPKYPKRFLKWIKELNNGYLKFIEEKSFPQAIENELTKELQYHFDAILDVAERTMLLQRIQNSLYSYVPGNSSVEKVMNTCKDFDALSLIYILYILDIHKGNKSGLVRFSRLYFDNEYNYQTERLMHQPKDKDASWVTTDFLKFFLETVPNDHKYQIFSEDKIHLAACAKQIAIPIRCLSNILEKLGES